MENNPKKSKALLITIIIIIIFIILAFLLYKNRDIFGVKTSNSIAKIFSPLLPSVNQTSKTILAQAGEDINQGDQVSLSGTSSDGNPLVMKAKDGDPIYGYANQAILNGNIGNITLTPTSPNNFFNSFVNFLNNLFNGGGGTDPPTIGECANGAINYPLCTTLSTGECNNGATNPPLCTTVDGECLNGANNPPLCTTLPGGGCLNGATNPPLCTTLVDGDCINGATNPPLCTTLPGGGCLNGATNPPLCTTIDDNDECLNGATNYPLCTTWNDECLNGADNPPLCTTLPGGECLNGATNPPLCTIDKVCSNGAINFPLCTIFDEFKLPDLTAGPVNPNNALLGTPTSLYSEIKNIGDGPTQTNFSSFFAITKTNPDVQINPNNNQTVSKSIFRKVKDKILNQIPKTMANDVVEISVVVPAMSAKTNRIIQTSYSFPTIGNYYIRVCADKTSLGDSGVINESDENNNCGPWTTLTVTSSLPPPGALPQCSDGLDNDGDSLIDALDPGCHVGGDLNKAYVPTHNSEANPPGTIFTQYQCSDGIDNDGDGLIDILDPGCHLDGDLSKTYVATHNDEENPPSSPIAPIAVEVNICKDIEQNPLVFTDEQKAELATLLRKFYLIAPTLKTEDDIKMIYQEMARYESFIETLDDLTGQCYSQGINKDGVTNPNYGGPILRFGNPWYKYTDRGSYVPDIILPTPSLCLGDKQAGPSECSEFNSDGNHIGRTRLYCNIHEPLSRGGNAYLYVFGLTGAIVNEITKDGPPKWRGCSWQANTDLREYEKILNVW